MVELDKVFWGPGLVTPTRAEWVELQTRLVEKDAWILDGDLGPHDAVEVRLHAADTIVFLDFSLVRCAWRAVRRSRERADFWLWLMRYRRQSRPFLMEAIANHAPDANVYVVCNPEELSQFLADVVSSYLPTSFPRKID
jgi:hypothetical protein